MADSTSDIQRFRSSFPFLDHFDPSSEPINHLSQTNQTIVLDNSNVNYFHSFLPFSSENYVFCHGHHALASAGFPGNFAENFPAAFHQNVMQVSSHKHASTPGTDHGHQLVESKKRKSMDMSETISFNSSPQVSHSGKRKNNSRRGKKAKTKEEEDENEKPKEVVHVRARRGQATDSHSLAERVRRGKINERLRCLQDIVPGCYKTMGMAVMLDEIINYVQSLQNQVEFLSMKLTAASTFYDFNSESDAMESMQRARAQEAKEIERVMKEGYGGQANLHPTWSL